MTKPNITVSFRWFDFWVGLFYDRVEKVLYLNPLPMLAIKIVQPDPDEAAWQYSAIAAAYIILATLLLWWIL